LDVSTSPDASRRVAIRGQSHAHCEIERFAAARSYGFTAGELKEHARAKAKASGREVTDVELDQVTGGPWAWTDL
jgi:hypothetical protein